MNAEYVTITYILIGIFIFCGIIVLMEGGDE